MYVRWIVRKLKNAGATPISFHDAYLVQNHQGRQGQLPQTGIYLGNLREIHGEFPGIERELFLLRARHTLAGLPDLTKAEHENIVDRLRQVAHPLLDEEIMHAFYQNLHWYVHACQERGIALVAPRQIYSWMESLKGSLQGE